MTPFRLSEKGHNIQTGSALRNHVTASSEVVAKSWSISHTSGNTVDGSSQLHMLDEQINLAIIDTDCHGAMMATRVEAFLSHEYQMGNQSVAAIDHGGWLDIVKISDILSP